MKRTILSLVFVTLIYSLAFTQNLPTPKIVSTVPAFGDCNVDTGAIDILFRFDQDMSSNITFGPSLNFPELNGKPKWIDARTLSLPVRLYPNKRYSLILNNKFPMRFESTSGVILNPQELIFHTKSDKNSSSNINTNLNKKAYQEIQKFFPRDYSYASIKGIDWNDVLKKYRNELENARSNSEFAIKLVKMLKMAEDPHLSIVYDGQRLETKYPDAVESNYNYKAVYKMLKNVKVSSVKSTFVGVIDSIGYISIGNWTTDPNMLRYKTVGDTVGAGASFDEVLALLTKFPNLIVDVRPNSGGNEAFAIDFASRFIKEITPYKKVNYLNEQTGLFDLSNIEVLEPSAKQMNYSGSIYVLSGPDVFSSNESFILMMKQVPNAKIIGMKTYGGSGNPIPHTLSNGVIINIPSWQAYTLDGKLVEGNGVEPDIEIITTKKDFATKDALLESVLKIIKEKTK